MINILNLGAGVQSTTVALMSIHGELPRLDWIYFADTGWEPAAVYQHLAWLREIFAEHDIPFRQVAQGNIREDILVNQVRGKKSEGSRWASMPLFVLSPEGKRGMVRRQCTYEYKIRPIEKAIKQDVFGLKPKQRWPTEVKVRKWFGISKDEWQRMRSSDQKWAEFYYPLVEKRMTRSDCLVWLDKHGYPMAPRSACIGCPFRSNKEWQTLTTTEMQDACEVDDAIRNAGGMRGQVFLHASRQPLRDVDLGDNGQLSLWDDECSGNCGV